VLVAAAVCPAAPVLVPEVAQGAAGELDDCRAACHDVIATVLAKRPDVVVVVGAGTHTQTLASGSRGSFEPVGVAVPVRLGQGSDSDRTGHGGTGAEGTDPGARSPSLPLTVSVGAWLLAQHPAAAQVSVHGLEVATDEPVPSCLNLGRALADDAAGVALLVVADGTARRGPAAPGYADERSAALDQAWISSLAEGSLDGLAALDPDLATVLMMAGRPPLQVLAGAAQGRRGQSTLVWHGDPYGVQYAVASWLRDGR